MEKLDKILKIFMNILMQATHLMKKLPKSLRKSGREIKLNSERFTNQMLTLTNLTPKPSRKWSKDISLNHLRKYRMNNTKSWKE